jgi:hypothetical protein
MSKLYMGGTCSSKRNNEGSGCSGSSGSVVPNTYSSSIDPSVCRSVFADGPSSAFYTLTPSERLLDRFHIRGWLCERLSGQPNPPASTQNRPHRAQPCTAPPRSHCAGPGRYTVVDSDSLCTNTYTGFFFLQNSCNQTGSAVDVDLRVEVTRCSGSCYYSTHFPTWARVSAGIFVGIFILAMLAFAFRRYQQRNQGVVAVTTVQLAPAEGYYTGSAAPAYGPQPGYYNGGAGQPAYAGAWGAQPAGYPPAGGTSGYGGGYGSQPLPAMAPPAPHQPAPMSTVTLGLPSEAEGGSAAAPTGGSNSSFYPPPSSGTAAGSPATGTSGPYPKV